MLQPIRYLLDRPLCFRPERKLAGSDFHRRINCAFQGTPNNRAEVSHEPTRKRERRMRRFKSPSQAQRFLSVHAVVGNLFRIGHHLMRATNYRVLRAKAFKHWQEVTCA